MTSTPRITLLTEPVAVGPRKVFRAAKAVARAIRAHVSPPPEFLRSPYGGHFAVTRSAVEGLRKLGVAANYNPTRVDDVAETVVVLSGLPALRQAIRLKQSGKIRKLLAGPNIVVFPSDARSVLAAPEVDYCLVPSAWVAELYSDDCRELEGRCRIWSAGVDETYWTPIAGARQPRLALIYHKPSTTPQALTSDYDRILKGMGYTVEVVKYGTFTHSQYREALRRCSVLVGFSGSESQGIAWAEAWAADVPTLIWFQGNNSYRGRTYRCSTAPYLTQQTGRFFLTQKDFQLALHAIEQTPQNFAPRQWILSNMSDRVSARRLVDFLGIAVDCTTTDCPNHSGSNWA